MTIPIGRGQATAHHGELVQGIFECEDAILRRGLVSLPCRKFKSKAVFSPTETPTINVTPIACVKALRAAELTLSFLGANSSGGHLSIESDVPIARGMGSSTADVVAAILAVHHSLHKEPNLHDVMRLAVSAEMACDSTAFTQQAVLFAQRDAVVIEAFRRALPPIDLVSVDADPGSTVGTLEFEPARYNSVEIEQFRVIRSLLRRAVDTADLNLLGRVATASARINERFLPKPRLVEIESIGKRFGALGIQVAHSGTVVGLMFDPNAPASSANIEQTLLALRRSGFEASFLSS
ncbi:GHMP kinase [Mesorhizobium sp. IMUNJ 23232]|uniref:GHMP family kinase ATP-binding protein n=1 Tax=Mesorhizobium sp. IMUNJ 23232 TaxID=3376064 RepID=UPI0037BD1BDD